MSDPQTPTVIYGQGWVSIGTHDHQWTPTVIAIPQLRQAGPFHSVEGLTEYAGHVFGPIAIYPTEKTCLPWQVAHIPSGYPLLRLSTEAKARAFVELLFTLPVDWNAVNAGIAFHRHTIFLMALDIENGNLLQKAAESNTM